MPSEPSQVLARLATATSRFRNFASQVFSDQFDLANALSEIVVSESTSGLRDEVDSAASGLEELAAEARQSAKRLRGVVESLDLLLADQVADDTTDERSTDDDKESPEGSDEEDESDDEDDQESNSWQTDDDLESEQDQEEDDEDTSELQ